jgi:hypothetical protein
MTEKNAIAIAANANAVDLETRANKAIKTTRAIFRISPEEFDAACEAEISLVSALIAVSHSVLIRYCEDQKISRSAIVAKVLAGEMIFSGKGKEIRAAHKATLALPVPGYPISDGLVTTWGRFGMAHDLRYVRPSIALALIAGEIDLTTLTSPNKIKEAKLPEVFQTYRKKNGDGTEKPGAEKPADLRNAPADLQGFRRFVSGLTGAQFASLVTACKERAESEAKRVVSVSETSAAPVPAVALVVAPKGKAKGKGKAKAN